MGSHSQGVEGGEGKMTDGGENGDGDSDDDMILGRQDAATIPVVSHQLPLTPPCIPSVWDISGYSMGQEDDSVVGDGLEETLLYGEDLLVGDQVAEESGTEGGAVGSDLVPETSTVAGYGEGSVEWSGTTQDMVGCRRPRRDRKVPVWAEDYEFGT